MRTAQLFVSLSAGCRHHHHHHHVLQELCQMACSIPTDLTCGQCYPYHHHEGLLEPEVIAALICNFSTRQRLVDSSKSHMP